MGEVTHHRQPSQDELSSSAALERSSASKRELLMQAEFGEVNFQQTKQLQINEQLLDEHAQKVHNLRDFMDAARDHNSTLEQQVTDLQEQVVGLQQQIEHQAAELAEARELEQKFAHMASEMGCIDAEGRLMQAELERVTDELIHSKASEAEYLEWMRDVKEKLANGREDGLAMALAENMAESRRKDKVIMQLDHHMYQRRWQFWCPHPVGANL